VQCCDLWLSMAVPDSVQRCSICLSTTGFQERGSKLLLCMLCLQAAALPAPINGESGRARTGNHPGRAYTPAGEYPSSVQPDRVCMVNCAAHTFSVVNVAWHCKALWAIDTAVLLHCAHAGHGPHVLLCRTCAWIACVAQMAASWQRLRPPFAPCTWRGCQTSRRVACRPRMAPVFEAVLWLRGWCTCSPGCYIWQHFFCYFNVACALCFNRWTTPNSLVLSSMSTTDAVARQ
jgi:hypothetical protein